MGKSKTLKLMPEQIATAISLLSRKEREKLIELVPDLGRSVRFRALDHIRRKSKDIPFAQVRSDVNKAVKAVRAKDA